jgi:hypothetical protein
VKIQNFLNNQPRQRNKLYSNNSYNQRSTPRIQPLTEEGLVARLSVNAETIRSERVNLPSPLFVAWCKSKDRAALGLGISPKYRVISSCELVYRCDANASREEKSGMMGQETLQFEAKLSESQEIQSEI